MILLTTFLLSVTPPTVPECAAPKHRVPSLIDTTLYFGAGAFFGSAALASGLGWALCKLTPLASTLGNECLVLGELLGIASVHAFAQSFKISPFISFLFKGIPSTHSAWDHNKKLLSQIPAHSHEDQELLHFLQKRWLAKTTGCYPFLVDWMCTSFGISYQVHPESTNSYARDPATKLSDTYANRVKAWKQFLPHPQEFPLILTRPFNIGDHLPSYFEISKEEEIQSCVERIKGTMGTDSLVIVDVTPVLPEGTLDRKQWLDAWLRCENQLCKRCEETGLDRNRILCIHRVNQNDLGGIRLLPLSSSSDENTENHYQYLLEWISRFGLTANRIELDRPLFSLRGQSSPSSVQREFESKEKWVAMLNSMESSWKSTHPQKTFLFKGTLQIVRALCTHVPDEKWEAMKRSTVRNSILQLTFTKIQEQLQLLIEQGEKTSFHEMASSIEQIHADFTSLLEIFTPFTTADFPAIYQRHLTSIPQNLQPLTGYGIHTSAMTSLGGIFKAAERTLGRPPRILFGENAYFECIHASERVSQAKCTTDSTEEDWKDVDLLLLQFNPTVKRINFEVTEYQATEYHVEKIAQTLHHALKVREGRPITLALDCTLDYSDSKRVGDLLHEFESEIERGDLNVICYRSGLKFDLFGMDNYCGAPFFMVHNRDVKWSCYDSLLADPALQTDRLSLNWFCVAYQSAAPYLELYRKQIFDNTRAVLDRIPQRLFNKSNSSYRVIPIDRDADLSFIDIKIFGPCHTLRGELLVGVYLTIKCMEAGYPLLFRPGIGFHHPNLAVLFGKECTTVRLTVGLDPAQVDVMVRCLKKIDACNG